MNTVDLGEIKMVVDDRGAGRPLLFVHGFPLDHTMWQAQIDEFSRDYRVLAPDLRGYNLTDKEPNSQYVVAQGFKG